MREPLRDAFCAHGVPEAMPMDHGTPWWSVQSTGGMTKLSLWLMQQGITLHWSRVRHPQTQGKVERFHGEIQRALARRRRGWRTPQSWLDEFRWEHNHVRPHEALAMQTPASRWRPSLRRYDPNPPRWEYSAGAKVLKVDSQGKLTLAGQNWKISLALAGNGWKWCAWRVDAKSTTAAL